ncbi:MAG: Plug domain-containing protein [Elusimicrobia bacterium]|nr:Plug domain-containing protein [Elusimicrobiota bacterium]
MATERRWLVLALLLAAPPCRAAEAEQEPIVITATRISEDVAQVPAAVTVIGGEELRDRGATDLGGALSLVSGVDIAAGSDSGPGTSLPEFWGLKEADAFLLVVDGVPWGGAFNPALASLDLRDVERRGGLAPRRVRTALPGTQFERPESSGGRERTRRCAVLPGSRADHRARRELEFLGLQGLNKKPPRAILFVNDNLGACGPGRGGGDPRPARL